MMITLDEYIRLMQKNPPEDFEELSARGWAEINRYLLYGLTGRDVDAFPETVKNDLLYAQAHQIDYLAENADWLNGTGGTGTLGKFSISAASGDGSGAPQVLSAVAKNCLAMVQAYLNELRWGE